MRSLDAAGNAGHELLGTMFCEALEESARLVTYTLAVVDSLYKFIVCLVHSQS